MVYYVNANVLRNGDGSKEHPFKTIQQAADLAMPGDEVIVAAGLYREYVDPKHAGTEEKRIVYRSETLKGAHITGAEPAKDWKHVEDNVFVLRIPNAVFGSYNPFTTLVSGDWFNAYIIAHTGDVFLNGKSMYEVLEYEKVKNPEISKTSWDPEFSLYTWYTEQDEEKDETILYANFGGFDPNQEDVEFSVRENCFYPSKEGVGYITFSGFTVSKAATQWAPPTAYQEGMIGPHWSKGWIIEDCEVFESKCSGISLGKNLQPENDNKWLTKKFKNGTQCERDVILLAQRQGWTKERIGSHIVRRCDIHDCGQTGIVGHLGGVFSIIEDNHIHHINNKHNLAGAEIGGIKMHAAIDVIYRRNHIHHCTRGIWLDWQAQGTRVTQNFMHDNMIPKELVQCEENMAGLGEDIFIEVSHGPTLLDNNIFLSEAAVKLATQGVAMVHNIIAGGFKAVGRGTDNGTKSLACPRYTPYHVPHRTEVAGFMTFLHGDNKFYNNIFINPRITPYMVEAMEKNVDNVWDDGNVYAGTFKFSEYPDYETWASMFEGYCGSGSAPSDRYYSKLPVWAAGNCYFNGAKPMDRETDAYVDTEHQVEIGCTVSEDGQYYLNTNLYELMPDREESLITTGMIAPAFEPEQAYENPDGTPIIFDRDYFDEKRGLRPMAGPFTSGSEAKSALF